MAPPDLNSPNQRAFYDELRDDTSKVHIHRCAEAVSAASNLRSKSTPREALPPLATLGRAARNAPVINETCLRSFGDEFIKGPQTWALADFGVVVPCLRSRCRG